VVHNIHTYTNVTFCTFSVRWSCILCRCACEVACETSKMQTDAVHQRRHTALASRPCIYCGLLVLLVVVSLVILGAAIGQHHREHFPHELHASPPLSLHSGQASPPAAPPRQHIEQHAQHAAVAHEKHATHAAPSTTSRKTRKKKKH